MFAAKFVPVRSSTRTRAFQERDLLSRLAHPRVACLLDFFCTRRTLVLITEMYPLSGKPSGGGGRFCSRHRLSFFDPFLQVLSSRTSGPSPPQRIRLRERGMASCPHLQRLSTAPDLRLHFYSRSDPSSSRSWKASVTFTA